MSEGNPEVVGPFRLKQHLKGNFDQNNLLVMIWFLARPYDLKRCEQHFCRGCILS